MCCWMKGLNLRVQAFVLEMVVIITLPSVDILVTECEWVGGWSKMRPKEEEFHNLSSWFASAPCVDVSEDVIPKWWTYLLYLPAERNISVRCQTFLLDPRVHLMFAHTLARQSKISHAFVFEWEEVHSFFLSSYLCLLIFTCTFILTQFKVLGWWGTGATTEEQHFFTVTRSAHAGYILKI